MLWRKLFREMRAQQTSFLAVILVLTLGIAIFVASLTGYKNLQGSYSSSRAQLHLADIQFGVSSPVNIEDLRQAVPSLSEAMSRVTLEVPAEFPETESASPVRLRLHGLDNQTQPLLNQIVIHDGTLPGPGEVALEHNLFDHHALKIGDVFHIQTQGSQQPLRVSARVSSAEYPWVARSELDLMPSPNTFGIGWTDSATLLQWGGAQTRHELLIATDAPDLSVVSKTLRDHLGSTPISSETTQDQLLGVKLVQLDVDGFRDLASFFPLIFLGVGAFIAAALLGRLVDAQLPLIGTLMALGFSRRQIFWHFSGFAVVIGCASSILGVTLGWVGGIALTTAYAQELSIPFIQIETHPIVLIGGALTGLLVSFVAVFAAARRAMSVPPAIAMRDKMPNKMGLLLGVGRHLGALPLPLRLAIRNVIRRPIRSLSTSIGVASALVLVLMTGEVLEGTHVAVNTQFEIAQSYDLRTDLMMPLPAHAVEAKLLNAPSVRAVQTFLSMPITLRFNGREKSTFLQALGPQPTLMRSVNFNGEDVLPSPQGIILSRNLAKSLGVSVGDTVTLFQAKLNQTHTARIEGFSDVGMGNMLFMNLQDVQGLFNMEGWINSVVIAVQPGQKVQATHVLNELPMKIRIQDMGLIREQMMRYMSLAWFLLGAMLFFSVLLASAILYNTATLSILERRREFATQRCLGFSMTQLTQVITLENSLLSCLGLLLGIPASMFMIRVALHLYASDLYSIPFVFSPTGVLSAIFGILVIMFIAQRPGLKQIRNANLAEHVRQRSE